MALEGSKKSLNHAESIGSPSGYFLDSFAVASSEVNRGWIRELHCRSEFTLGKRAAFLGDRTSLES